MSTGMNEPKSPEKQMIPFIVVLSFVILSTVILLALRSLHQNREEKDLSASHSTLEGIVTPASQISDASQASDWNADEQPSLSKGLAVLRNQIADSQLQNAENTARTLLVFYPADGALNHMMAQVLYAMERYAEAQFYLQKACLFLGVNPLILNELALSVAKQDKFPEAVKIMEQVLKEYPEFPVSEINMALIYSRWKNLVQAERFLLLAHQRLGDRVFRLADDPDFQCLKAGKLWHDLISKKTENAVMDRGVK